MVQHQASRLLNLDLLRLLSALLVVGYHFGFRMEISGEGGGLGFPEFSSVAIWFDIGLLIFFAISGYVITLSSEGRSAYEFAVGRVARLWPTFVLCASVTAVVLTAWPVPGLPTPTVKQWLAHLVINARVLGQPFLDGAYWTIAYEVIFYGWVFLLIAIGWFDRYWRPIVVAWLMISAANELMIDNEALRKLFITQYSGYFAFGIVLYRLGREVKPSACLILAAAVVWATIGLVTMEPGFFKMYAVHRNILGIMVTGPIALGCVALAVLAPTLPIEARTATALGALTYPLYLLHQNIGYAVFAQFGADYGRWLVGALYLAALLLASWLVATYVEPPGRMLIRRLAGRGFGWRPAT